MGRRAKQNGSKYRLCGSLRNPLRGRLCSECDEDDMADFFVCVRVCVCVIKTLWPPLLRLFLSFSRTRTLISVVSFVPFSSPPRPLLPVYRQSYDTNRTSRLYHVIVLIGIRAHERTCTRQVPGPGTV